MFNSTKLDTNKIYTLMLNLRADFVETVYLDTLYVHSKVVSFFQFKQAKVYFEMWKRVVQKIIMRSV